LIAAFVFGPMTPSIGPGSWPFSFNAACTFFTFSLPPPRAAPLFWLSLLMSIDEPEEPISDPDFFAEPLLLDASDDVPASEPLFI